jgi:hypothetical protein
MQSLVDHINLCLVFNWTQVNASNPFGWPSAQFAKSKADPSNQVHSCFLCTRSRLNNSISLRRWTVLFILAQDRGRVQSFSWSPLGVYWAAPNRTFTFPLLCFAASSETKRVLGGNSIVWFTSNEFVFHFAVNGSFLSWGMIAIGYVFGNLNKVL